MSDIDNMIERLTDRQQHEFTLHCARRVPHLMTDPRSVAALDTRQRWMRGEATDEEMAVAWAAARAAARAASDAASDAAWAASDAADAADAASLRDAAWDAERAWQRAELERLLGEGGGA